MLVYGVIVPENTQYHGGIPEAEYLAARTTQIIKRDWLQKPHGIRILGAGW